MLGFASFARLGLSGAAQALRDNLPQLQAPGGAGGAGDRGLPGPGDPGGSGGAARVAGFLDRRGCEAKLGAISQNPIVAASLTAAALTYNGDAAAALLGSAAAAAGGGAPLKGASRKKSGAKGHKAPHEIDFEALHAALDVPVTPSGSTSAAADGVHALAAAAEGSAAEEGSGTGAGNGLSPSPPPRPPWRDLDPGVVDEEGKVQVPALTSCILWQPTFSDSHSAPAVQLCLLHLHV